MKGEAACRNIEYEMDTSYQPLGTETKGVLLSKPIASMLALCSTINALIVSMLPEC
jgi:hypothetical protein